MASGRYDTLRRKFTKLQRLMARAALLKRLPHLPAIFVRGDGSDPPGQNLMNELNKEASAARRMNVKEYVLTAEDEADAWNPNQEGTEP